MRLSVLLSPESGFQCFVFLLKRYGVKEQSFIDRLCVYCLLPVLVLEEQPWRDIELRAYIHQGQYPRPLAGTFAHSREPVTVYPAESLQLLPGVAGHAMLAEHVLHPVHPVLYGNEHPWRHLIVGPVLDDGRLVLRNKEMGYADA